MFEWKVAMGNESEKKTKAQKNTKKESPETMRYHPYDGGNARKYFDANGGIC